MIKIIEGNLIQIAMYGTFDLIIHGCNCQCTFGKGIAAQIKKYFPEAFAADKLTIKGDRNKLGKYTTATIKLWKEDKVPHNLIIVNAYIQYYWGYSEMVNYDAIESIFKRIKEEYSGLKIGIPMIGAGNARGDWNKIYSIIENIMKDEDLTIIKYKPHR